MKRPLNETELKISKKNLELIKDELEGLEKIDIARKQLALDTAEIEFNRQIKQLEKDLKGLKNEANVMKETVKILEDQIQNGVEEKEEASDTESEKEVN